MFIDNSQFNVRCYVCVVGVIYLLNVFIGIFVLGYVLVQIGGYGDVVVIVQNIIVYEVLFCVGIVVGVICYFVFLLLLLVFYCLLGVMYCVVGVVMVVLVMVSVLIGFVILGYKLDVFILFGYVVWLQLFSVVQVQMQVMLQFDVYGNGLLFVQVFWGLWLLLFGWLVICGCQLLWLFGYLLVFGGFFYVMDFVVQLFVFGYSDIVFVSYVMMFVVFGEIGICLWLLIVGVWLVVMVQCFMMRSDCW